MKLLFAFILILGLMQTTFAISDTEFLTNCFADFQTCCLGFPENFQQQNINLYYQFLGFMTQACIPYGN